MSSYAPTSTGACNSSSLMRSEGHKGFVSKAPKRGNMLAQGVNPGLEAPSPRLRHPLPQGREGGWGEGGSLNPRLHAVGYVMPLLRS